MSKNDEVALVASVGAVMGAAARGVGLTTGNQYADAAIGAAIAGISYYLDMDGITEFGEGFGVGYFFSSIL